jgi:type I restriction enzyme S subunit
MLGEIATFEMGQAPPGFECNKNRNGTVFVKAGEFGRLYPDEKEWTTRPLKFGKKGDVFICVVGATAGKLNLGIDCAIGRSVAAIRPQDGINTRFVYYQLQPHVLKLRAASSGSAQGVISKAQLEQIPFRVMPLDQQEVLVAELEKQFSRLDEAATNFKRVKANLKRYKASVLKAAVEGEFFSIDPSGWTRTYLGAVLTTIEAGKSFKCEERLPNIREIGVVKVSAVTWGTYDEEESKTCLDPDRIETRYFVKPGDFLFSRANTIQLVGRCVIAQKVTRKVMLSDKILRFHFTNMVVPHWVLYWLQSDIGRKEIERLSTGNQESMRNIGQDRIRQIAFALPSLKEQRAIVAEVERHLSVIEELEAAVEANLTRADRLRQSILSNAFAGKLVCANTNRSGERSTDIQMAKSLE